MDLGCPRMPGQWWGDAPPRLCMMQASFLSFLWDCSCLSNFMTLLAPSLDNMGPSVAGKLSSAKAF